MKLRVSRHRESTYYLFGLRAGFANLIRNGFHLGLRKTAGKIAQPVNAYSRFAEYNCFDSAIRRHAGLRPRSERMAMLDVGSPKLFGLFLAEHMPIDLVLTDISDINVDEYSVMWQAIRDRAQGAVRFVLQDGRALGFPDNAFDVVYSMSVLEHIEGPQGDTAAMVEFVRVLKPGGLLVVSVPFGPMFQEQDRTGFSGAARYTGDSQTYFFQRIYDRAQLERRLVEPIRHLSPAFTTLTRRHPWAARAFGRLGDNVRGAMGFMNPVLSSVLVGTAPGIDDAFPTHYGPSHAASDVYGDIVLTAVKA